MVQLSTKYYILELIDLLNFIYWATLLSYSFKNLWIAVINIYNGIHWSMNSVRPELQESTETLTIRNQIAVFQEILARSEADAADWEAFLVAEFGTLDLREVREIHIWLANTVHIVQNYFRYGNGSHVISFTLVISILSAELDA